MTQNGTPVTQNGEINAPGLFQWAEFSFESLRYKYGTAPAFQEAAAYRTEETLKEPLIRIICCKSGNLTVYTGVSRASSILLDAHSHNLLYFPANTKVITEYDMAKCHELLIIDLEPDILGRYIPLESLILRWLNEQITSSEFSVLHTAGLPLSPEMKMVIHEIIHCKRLPTYKAHYLKIKAIEFVLLQVEQYRRVVRTEPSPLRGEELLRIYQVRDILLNETSGNHTLKTLAHRVGTNDATLKKHFKLVFGTTVFNYLAAIRMQSAKEMLIRKNEKVAVVAQHVGYKHATHFTAAFKRHFGYLPTEVKIQTDDRVTGRQPS